MDEIGGAVQRVNDPDILGVFGAVFLPGFLGQNAMPRVGGEQSLDDDLLSGLIHLGHKVVDLFLRNTNRFNVQRSAVDDVARSARGLDGHIDHRVKVGRRHKL